MTKLMKKADKKKSFHIYRRVLGKCLEKGVIKFKLVKLNEPVKISGPVIYAANHSSMYDVPVAINYIKKPFTLLAGKENLDIQAKLLFGLNSVRYVQRNSKDSRNDALEYSFKKLENGKSILIFPEATWNLSVNQVMLPLYWGIIKMAQKTGSPIIPMIFEYYDDICYIKSGNPIYISQVCDQKKAIEDLTGVLGGLRWDIWDIIGPQKREDVLKEQFDNYVNERLNEYACFNKEFEDSVILKKYEEVERPEEIINCLKITKNNAYLLKK